MAVVLDEGAATAGGLHNCLGAFFDARPPRVDVAPGAIEAGGLGVQVVVHGTAATGFAGRDDADSQPVQHPRRRGIGVG
ncbi:hypothetical protein D3C85_1243360 [compost metagenome]